MKKILLISFAILFTGVVLIAAGASYWIFQKLQPVQPTSTELTAVVIPHGSSVSAIGQKLAEEELIRSPFLFRMVVKQQGLEGKLQAGTFELSPGMTMVEIARSLTQGTRDVWITILEGWRHEQIASYLAEQELAMFDEATFNQLSADDEGYLFPETYLVPRASTAEDIHELLLDTFEERVLTDLEQEFAQSERSQQDIITMASIVEREARDYQQMRRVAGILWNRIDIGMALQVDATLQYITGYDEAEETWWQIPTPAEKEIESPYNTYQNPGLPPQPIANPSLRAIQATLDPIESDDLFYLHDPQGGMHYAEDLAGHNANIDRYLR